MHHDQDFKAKMFKELNIKQTNLDKVHGSIKSYRDKFVAHLDSEETMNIPKLEEAFCMVCFLLFRGTAVPLTFTTMPFD